MKKPAVPEGSGRFFIAMAGGDPYPSIFFVIAA